MAGTRPDCDHAAIRLRDLEGLTVAKTAEALRQVRAGREVDSCSRAAALELALDAAPAG